jgi:hypothetical protein
MLVPTGVRGSEPFGCAVLTVAALFVWAVRRLGFRVAGQKMCFFSRAV